MRTKLIKIIVLTCGPNYWGNYTLLKADFCVSLQNKDANNGFMFLVLPKRGFTLFNVFLFFATAVLDMKKD